MAPAAPKPARKRNRKRKRRAASSDSSSSDDSSDSESSQTPKTLPAKAIHPGTSKSSEDSSSSSSSSESDSESEVEHVEALAAPPAAAPAQDVDSALPRQLSPSPEPSRVQIPSFLPVNPTTDDIQSEKALKAKFTQFWMASLADGFKDDLEQIRREPNLGPSRLALLIDSLAAGADVFSSASKDGTDVNEMEVVLDGVPQVSG
ncbi:hypothetical protein BV22DRAFT_1079346 [Leucogyrophana mollusca]|uniref:Uncharacterized protein n=1 Tax=Leucogyrophana mollusca TaxID=85980 RepID=A0ACB8BXP7_9AGAM|nr:hypothetical protein BV22DRAFT_1079346 [Leucogyrophana mollusca]